MGNGGGSAEVSMPCRRLGVLTQALTCHGARAMRDPRRASHISALRLHSPGDMMRTHHVVAGGWLHGAGGGAAAPKALQPRI
jgi:hypothetical protein